jgi:DsbC/DsbD-like thiol-disulfide interchange protein/outer membrane protein assembly factor BamB
VLALTHAGKPAWETNLGFFSEDHGSGASPVVVGKVLVVAKDHSSDDAFLTGLSVADGKPLWKLPRKTARSAFSTPMIVETEKGKPVVVFTSNPNAMTAVDPATGKILWNQDYAAKTEYRAVGSAAYCDGVYFTNVGQGTGGRSGAALKIVDGKPETAWELPKAMPYVPTPLGMQGHFYVLNDGGILSCLKAATGTVVYSERVGDNAYSSPVCAGNQIYCISRAGKVTVVKAGEQFEILGKSDLGEPCESTPAIANGMIFIRTAKHLIALGGATTEASNTYHGIGVDIEMICEHQTIQPGKSFTVGFNLKHTKGWHTYWKNPGLAGVPFAVDWALPEGWTAAEMQYAPPDKVFMSRVRTHGYERDVTHLVQITPPANLPTATATIEARAHWLCCSTTCQLGHCGLSMTLPVTATTPVPEVKSYQAISAAKALLPQENQRWKFTAKREGEKVRLTCSPMNKKEPAAITPEPIFFSNNRLICSDPVQQWNVEDGKLVGVLPVAEYAPAELTQLSGLLLSEGKYVALELKVDPK